MSTEPLHVAVGVLRRADGDVLLSQRMAGTHLAGYWEFPGGKLEPGETPQAALARELREELGIEIVAAEPLIRHRHHYPAGANHPARQVVLHTFEITAWNGEPRGVQGQALHWAQPDTIDPGSLPPANGPLLTAARLPDLYAISAEYTGAPDAYLAHIDHWATRGVRLACLRSPGLDSAAYRHLAEHALARARQHGIALLLHGDAALAMELGAAGVHLPGRVLAATTKRPVPQSLWLAASCHDASQLEKAAHIGCDFAVLSQVAVTASHPGQPPLGWQRFKHLVDASGLPVYALGGVRQEDATMSRSMGGRGIAAQRSLWR
ncbi:MAG: Nudix family hydrolase [Immundisolibacter sp.]|uniref:Nudix family hydrolase n=1 Tax=Immundisolibacter sp. TaxID=1934948 RepID=UPI003D11455C